MKPAINFGKVIKELSYVMESLKNDGRFLPCDDFWRVMKSRKWAQAVEITYETTAKHAGNFESVVQAIKEVFGASGEYVICKEKKDAHRYWCVLQVAQKGDP